MFQPTGPNVAAVIFLVLAADREAKRAFTLSAVNTNSSFWMLPTKTEFCTGAVL